MDRPPARSRLYEAISRAGIISWSLLGTLLLFGAALWVLSHVENLLPAVVFALAILFVLNPVVTRLHRFGVPRLLGSCLSYLFLAGLLTLLGWLVLPSITDQATEFGDRFPEIYDRAANQAQEWIADFNIDADVPNYEELRQRLNEAAEDGDFVTNNLSRIGDVTLTILETLLLLIFAPVVAFYLLMDLPTLREKSVALVPGRLQGEVAHVSRELGTAVGGFIRGQVLVALIVGVMTSVGFWLIDLPFFLLIGMIAGFLNIIPFVGPWVGGALGVLVGLTESDFQTAVLAAVVAIVVQQIDNHFITPNVLRATVRLHPATIIFVLLIGGTLSGIWGVLLAVPVTATVKIIFGHYWRTRVLGQSWEEASEAIIDETPTPDTLITRLRRIGDAPAADRPAGGPLPPPSDEPAAAPPDVPPPDKQ